ncbi:patatin [Nostoc sp. CENA543]|uniref:patatin-like phospholipase family protein n=1 Tax=Nostoc sp. CENA543 TaxID=1869241 RepID=UPI000CA0A8DA|nr:patatin-like phospholipase family protein [Nostoc sp. CENA543]AUT03470.1 patatin [Nostoc sp. CENA543]
MSFKILSLDGGGIRGVITARILQEVERQIQAQKGQSLWEYFDLIAGTSTGSILTAGIAVGKSSDYLVQMYVDRGQTIFPRHCKERFQQFPDFIQPLLEAFAPPKYSHQGLIDVLKSALGDKRIQEIKNKIILILAYDTLYRNTTFFTNCHPDVGLRWYDECHLWQLCTASASAPTFFPPYKLEPVNKKIFGDWVFPHIDGGVGANNPALAALSLVLRLSQSAIAPEIKREYKLEGVSLEDIAILSIGTGQSGEPFMLEQVQSWRGINWAQHLIDIFMEPTSEISSTICRQIMGGYNSQRYLRLQFDLNERFQPKDKESFRDTRILLEREQRINRFTQSPLSEEMDDARPETIKRFIDAASQFVDEGCTYYTRNDCGPRVKDAIAAFIKSN